MEPLYASRMNTIPKSFIREILKVTEDPQIISFAGGLPNPRFFPVREIAQATASVLAESDGAALQYGRSEGYTPLRDCVARRYRDTKGLDVSPDEVLITNGSQQALDLLGKVFIDRNDAVAIERPAYLGAIQAFSTYQPQFHPISLLEDGIDIDRLAAVLNEHRVKFFHTVINFQNPSGVSCSAEKRATLAELLRRHETTVLEDDPYGDLRFEGQPMPSLRNWLDHQAVLLGSFSKIVAPGLRLGWLCARRPIIDKLVVAKQASDLHTNSFCQRVLHRYLTSHDVDDHITTIIAAYRSQRDVMLAAIKEHFPPEVGFTRPQGGMFLWVTLPRQLPAMELFERAVGKRVAFVPGTPFFVDGGGTHNLRLNFSNANEDMIEEGIRRLGKIMKEMLTN